MNQKLKALAEEARDISSALLDAGVNVNMTKKDDSVYCLVEQNNKLAQGMLALMEENQKELKFIKEILISNYLSETQFDVLMDMVKERMKNDRF